MDVRKMMGRLYPQNIKFDVGRGGLPELTPQDIAAAVGMCQDERAREVFCMIWWPQNAAATARTRQMLLTAVLAEFNTRYAAVDVARRELRTLEAEAALRNATSDEMRRDLARAKSVVNQLHAAVWPARMEKYPRIIDAVIEEMRSPRHCPDCEGRGTITSGRLVKDCLRCNGTGHVDSYNVWRADRVGTSEARFRTSWLPVYQWVYAMVEGLASTAAERIFKALQRDEAA